MNNFLKNNKQGYRYNDKIYNFCSFIMSISSPSTLEVLSEAFGLPSVRSLQRFREGRKHNFIIGFEEKLHLNFEYAQNFYNKNLKGYSIVPYIISEDATSM